ncbi:MAG: polysaccharide biosynthesis tyrosine autokinase [Chlorobiaceae bacterium]
MDVIGKKNQKKSLINSYKNSANNLTIEMLLKIVQRRKYGMIAIFFVSMAGAFIYHLAQIPEYYAESIIIINSSKDSSNFTDAVVGPSKDAENISTKKDVELISSMPMAELTVKELHKLKGKKALEIFGERTYSTPIASLLNELTPIASLLNELKESISIEVLSASQKPSKRTDPDEIIRHQAFNLISRLNIEPIRDTNILKVAVASPFPDEAALLTNTLCRVYKEVDVRRNSEKYAQANKFISDMLQEQQSKVNEADSELSQYMTQHAIYEGSGNTQQLLSSLTEAEAKYKEALSEYNIAKNGLNYLEHKLSDTDKAVSLHITQNVNTQLGTIMDEIRTRENGYVQLLREKGADDPEVKTKRQELEVVKTRYDLLSRSKIAGEIGYAGQAQKYSYDLASEKLKVEKKLNELNFSATEFNRLKKYYENQLSLLPKKQQNYTARQRDKDVIGKTYVALKEKLDQTRVLIGSEVGGISINGAAIPPFFPDKPNLARNILMGTILGGFFAACYAFGMETIDDTIKDEELFTAIGFSTLSVIPFIETDVKVGLSYNRFKLVQLPVNKTSDKKALTDGSSCGVNEGFTAIDNITMPLLTDNLTSAFTESFRMLRTSLDYYALYNPLKSILISGTAMSEGKSTVCTNLGLAYALIGKKTLIIDCDLRRASQHNRLNCLNEPGLTDYLTSEHESLDNVMIQSTHIHNLFLLSSGKKVKSPNELLASEKMQHLIEELKDQFDMVLIDSPPLFLSDAAQIMPSVEGILLASRLKYTNSKPILELVDVEMVRSRVLGVVLISSRDLTKYGYGKYGYAKYEHAS